MKTLKPRRSFTSNFIYLKRGMLLLSIIFIQSTYAQITVNSLVDLLPYLDDDNVNIVLAPGTYSITTSDITAGTFSNPLLLFEGSNSTYDFTGVRINFETAVFKSFGSVEVKEIQILGNDNVLKNLTMVDIGDTSPQKTVQGITMDGRDNRIEGFHISTRGSYPYGYGDAFGKGGTNTVIGHRKHSAVLIRGLRNHFKDNTVISRSYGHCVFMQAASYPIIEGCYIEGEVRTTDDMLAEAGTGTPADNKNFMTTWGYTLPPGYMMSLQEAGIRAYNAGTTYIDGVTIQRGTDNPTVLNCTIKNTRTGVVLAHATGTSYIEGCTVLGCEMGYSIGGNGTIVNCGADAIYGPVYKNAYASDNGYVADITILQPSDDYYNGHDALAYIGGSNHDLTFRGDVDHIPSNLKIMAGGDLQGLRVLNGSNASQNNHTVSNLNLKNLTSFPVVLDADCSNSTVKTCDTSLITDNGSNNTISSLNCDVENLALTGIATQVSTAYGGDASRAIDGNTNGSYNGGNSVTHTLNSETNAWWQVDLGRNVYLGDVIVHNRTDGSLGSRLSNYSVSVIDSNGNTTFSQSFTTAPSPSTIINTSDAFGQIVKIQLDQSGPLSLAEVEVFKSSNLALSGVATQVSTDYGGDASRAIDNNTDGSYGNNSVTHTESNESAAWWEVYLGAEKNIGDINIFNRTGRNYGDRLSDFTVSVIDINGNTTFSQVVTTAPNPSLIVDASGAIGNKVKIQLNESGPLSLAEIQVFEFNTLSKSGDKLLSHSVEEVNKTIFYPNPVFNHLNISLGNSKLNLNESTVSIFNTNGQLLLQSTLIESGEISMDVSSLSKGVYIVRIHDKTTFLTEKLIKQ